MLDKGILFNIMNSPLPDVTWSCIYNGRSSIAQTHDLVTKLDFLTEIRVISIDQWVCYADRGRFSFWHMAPSNSGLAYMLY